MTSSTSLRNFYERCKYLIFPYYKELRLFLGLPVPLKTKDRFFLEEDIFPWINAEPGLDEVLFIGTSHYTKHYIKLIKKRLHTIDIDPLKSRFGSKNNHVIGSALNLSDYYENDFFDIIVCNGVVGHGVDDIKTFNELVKSLAYCLKNNGVLILGLHLFGKIKKSDIDRSCLKDHFDIFIPEFVNASGPNIKVNKRFIIIDETNYGCYFLINKYH